MSRIITVARQAGAGAAPEGYDVQVDGRVITATGTASPTILPGGVQIWLRAGNTVGLSG